MAPGTALKRLGLQGFEGTIGPGRYFATGVLLAAVKLPLDHLLATQGFGRPWGHASERKKLYAKPGFGD